MPRCNGAASRVANNRVRYFGSAAGIICAALALAASILPGEAAEKLSRAEKAKLASEVKSIFEGKCVKCHGPEGFRETEKPKGEFDYILDLARLANSPKLVVPGDADNSKLYNMVADLLMPDDAAGEEPLSDNEIKLIGRWIELGAPTEKGVDAAMRFECPATKKIDLKILYTPDQLEERRFSTRIYFRSTDQLPTIPESHFDHR